MRSLLILTLLMLGSAQAAVPELVCQKHATRQKLLLELFDVRVMDLGVSYFLTVENSNGENSLYFGGKVDVASSEYKLNQKTTYQLKNLAGEKFLLDVRKYFMHSRHCSPRAEQCGRFVTSAKLVGEQGEEENFHCY